MSDNYLRLIPRDPAYVPGETQMQAAEARLRTLLPEAELVRGEQSGQICFVDCGANLETIRCPLCGGDVLVGSVWQQLMDHAATSKFRELDVVVPCCGGLTNLNELSYHFPCGFASFVLEARNPGQGLADGAVAEIGTILGCRLRLIWAHY